MLQTYACPNVRDLQRLARAQLAVQAAQLLRQHLDQCSRCLEIVQLFEADAPALDGTRGSPDAQGGGSGTWRGGLAQAAAPTLPLVTRTNPLSGVGPLPPLDLARATSPGPASSTGEADRSSGLLSLLSPPQAADELGRIGPYRVLRVLGTGATGVVYVAEDLQLRRQVALKVMKPAPEDNELARQRFLREAQASAGLNHEHIVTVYQVGEDRGVPYLAMQLLEGETLADRLKRDGQLLVHDVLRIGRQVAAGLAAAHERGLIHRDIKPANIFLEMNGRVKIVDFGLARGVSDDHHLTRTGTIVGTPAYMSPEQARGMHVDPRSDLFSLGCVLYRACAGRPPFNAEGTLGMLTALVEDQPPPLKTFNANLPDLLVGLVNQLLAKRPEGRPKSAEAVVQALDTLADLVASARDPMHLRLQDKRPGGGFWSVFFPLLALAGLGWLLWWYGPTVVRAISQQVQAIRWR